MHLTKSQPMLLPFVASLLLLNTFFSVALAATDDDNPILQTYCNDSPKFPSGSTFEANLKLLLSILVSNGPHTGFYNATLGDSSDRVYGLAQCRGDISSKDCLDCLNTARAELSRRCPSRTRVVIGYEFCLIRYANQPFFSQPDLVRIIPYESTVFVAEPELFKQMLGTLMNNLSSKAAFEPTRFGVGVIGLGQVKIYGLVQCTRDLSQKDCLLCSQRLIKVIPVCCEQRRGARILSPTCVIRYEVEPFTKRFL